MSNDTKKYVKLTQREHILARPDSYVGSNELTSEELWVYEEDKNKIEKKSIKFNPALLKIYDEAIVNASDAAINDKTCDYIKVVYNREDGYISVENNGEDSVPIEMHPEYKILVPSMIFGELLTSSNYDDEKERSTGGRNGLGIKLNNIFSTKFIVEIVDCKRKKKFIQEWSNNMETIGKPKVTDVTAKTIKPFIRVTFYPDVKRFGIDSLNNDHYNLFYRRAIDIAAIRNNLKVYFNDNLIKINNFKSYIDLHYSNETIYLDESNDRWQVGVIYKQDTNETISFVNSINTYRGGTHCNHVIDNIIKTLINDYIKKKDKDLKVSPQLLKDNFVFFINSTLINPTFSSQTKDTCTSKPDKFGSKYVPQAAFLKKLAKCGIVEQIIELVKFKESSTLKKTDGKKQVRLIGIPKLDDANKAGSKDSYRCSLILTEGDSAKTFAVSGLSVIGRDYFGVFPLKGKLLNVREAPPAQLLANEEITNLKKIIGLKSGEDYTDDNKFNQLRYGRIVILTDADVDGSHIKGLVMNFIHSQWPSLIKRKNFITSLATPIVKATKGSDILSFYNLTEYDKWLESNESNKNWKIKYYKGLGTSTAVEAREYFIDIENKLINYKWENKVIEDDDEKNDEDNDEDKDEDNDENDENEDDDIILPYKTNDDEDAILLAFEKARADDRKVWLQNYNKNDVLLYENKIVRYSNFIHSDLIHFSNDDLSRSIPSLIDGLKPSQRKILYGAMLRGLDKTEVKVAQLAGFVSDKAAYHHGEASLTGAIVGMAQNYMGSNNINILKPNGQFGCLAPDTPIIMWNNCIKRADEITVGDKLIGDDGNERTVLQTTNGIDDMYKIIFDNDSFTCNSQHILTLFFKQNNKIYWSEEQQKYKLEYFNGKTINRISIKIDNKENSKENALNEIIIFQKEIQNKYNSSKIIDIKLEDYLKLSKYFKPKLYMFYNYNSINWIKKDVPIDPYTFGIWLGDNTCKQFINCEKIISKYIYNNRRIRLQLLAGLIDTCGKIKYSQSQSYYEIIKPDIIYDKMFESISTLAKTLGFTTSVSVNNNNKIIKIMGNNLNQIPCRLIRKQINIPKNIYQTSHFLKFNIEYLGKDNFYGWQVDKNERFLLGNYIVTHNSRLKNGSDSASPRYIWTKLEDLTPIIFNPSDSPILINQFEDNEPIEPEYYAPIIPMILVNGAQGIGTGFATKIPPYDPIKIIDNLKRKLISNHPFEDMDPYWTGFEGSIYKVDDFNYEIYGSYQINNNKLIITELPVGESTYGYKEFLENLLAPEEPKKQAPTTKGKTVKKQTIKSKQIPFLGYTENNTDTKVYFELEFESGYLENTKDVDKLFHLYKKYSITNMHLFDSLGTIKKYNSPIEIMDEYYVVRFKLYEKRKEHELNILKNQLKMISNKVKFILMIVDKKIIVNNKKRLELELELEKHKFDKFDSSYNYLLGMPIYNLTTEKIEELKKQESDKETQYEELEKLTIETIWLNELNKLEKEYNKWINHKSTENNTKKVKKSKK
jgi:DNA gyrase/topoisomerase IV subunit B